MRSIGHSSSANAEADRVGGIEHRHLHTIAKVRGFEIDKFNEKSSLVVGISLVRQTAID